MSKKEDKAELLKQLDERTTARGLLGYAWEYYAAYELIQEQEPKYTMYFSVKYYLLCHSLELSMKVLLKQEGASLAEMQKLGHDLEKIMMALHDKHDVLFDDKSQAMIRLVNQHYAKKDFEYAFKGAKRVPEITELAQTVHLLISKARFAVIMDSDPRKLREANNAKS